jgi:tetratricopeptide (TPR) repeat protein
MSDIMENVVGPIVRVSRCVVAIVTAQSVLSDYFVAELTLSDDHSKPIVVWQPDKAPFDDPAELAAVSKPDYLRIADESASVIFSMFSLEPPTEEEKAESARRKVLEVKRRMTSNNIIATLTQGEDEIESVVDFLQELVAELRLMQERRMPVTGLNTRVAIAGRSAFTADAGERPTGDRNELASANSLGNRGYALQGRGHLAEAWELHTEALSLHRRAGSRKGEAIDLGNFGVIELNRGNLEPSLSYFLQALEIHRSIRNPEGEADQINNAAIVERLMGDLDGALARHLEALTIYRNLHSPRGEASQYANLGNVYHSMKRLDDAVEHQKRALNAYRKLELPEGQAKCLANLGLIAEEQGEMEEALKHFREALPLARQSSSRYDEVNMLLSIGRVFKAQDMLSLAKGYLSEALAAARQFGFYDLESASNILLGEMDESEEGNGGT